MEDAPVYIHYGSDEYFTPNPIQNRFPEGWTKPLGGVWASRKDDPDGWKSWCEKEEFRLEQFDSFFEFTLKEGARVLVLKDPDQLDALPKSNNRYNKNSTYSECYLDFAELSKMYDAIELMDIGKFYWRLYGWDCNSILIMNPDIVNVIEKEPA